VGRYIKNSVTASVKGPITGGVNVPAGSAAERPADAVEGTTRFNTDTNNLEVHNGTNFDTIAREGNVSITKDSFTEVQQHIL